MSEINAVNGARTRHVRLRIVRNRSRSGAITYAAAAVIAGDGGSREGAG